jgi:hypothetical protein
MLEPSRLVEIRPADPPRQEKWVYLCACGKQVIKTRREVRRGKIKSCGCLNDELRLLRNKKHGYAYRGKKFPVYHVWHAMIRRCTSSSDHSYPHYGGRGISVCQQWLTFSGFLHDMGIPPPSMSLERKDNNGPYSPENCIWADKNQQMNNTRRNRRIVFQGQNLTLAQWAKVTGIHRTTIASRLRRGLSVQDALAISESWKEGKGVEDDRFPIKREGQC